MRDNPNLDLMRSVAVCLVIFSHLWLYTGSHFIPGGLTWFLGMLGVFIFFTHTTLVLMWSLERDPYPLRFYVRRAFRLYPLWLVVLFLSLAVHLPTAPVYAPAFAFLMPGRLELLHNALLVMNLTGEGSRVIGASWSLPVEVQMYVVLPLLFFFARSNQALVPLFLMDGLAILTARSIDKPLASDLLFCAPLFIPGAIAYAMYRGGRKASLPGWLFPVWLVSLIASVDWYASRSQDSFRSGWWFTLALGCSLPMFRPLSQVHVKSAAHWIARYSYGFYLCHFAAIAVAVHYLSGYPLALRAAAFFAVLIGLSVGFYHAVEQPMIRFGSRIAGSIGHKREPPMDSREMNLEMAP